MKYEIERFNPCVEAIEFRAKFDSFEESWDACERGDWMLWIACELNIGKILFLAKGECAKTVIHLMKDDRSKKAVKAAIDYGNGKITKKQLNTAYTAAYAAAAAAAADAAGADAYAGAGAYAAYAAAAAGAGAAYAAAGAADAYADVGAAGAAAAGAGAAYKIINQLQTANICRGILTKAVFEKIKKLED